MGARSVGEITAIEPAIVPTDPTGRAPFGSLPPTAAMPEVVQLGALSRVLASITSSVPVASPIWVTTGQPLVNPADATASVVAQKIAANLSAALLQSGLFFEAHLREWSAGLISVEDLQKEPQSQQQKSEPLGEAETTSEDGQPRSKHQRALPDNPDGHAVSLTILRQQIEIIDTGQIAFACHLFPGVVGHFKFEHERSDGSGEEKVTAPRQWKGSMELELQTLGAIRVEFCIAGEKVDIAISASAAAVSALTKAESKVIAQLSQLGLTPTSFAIVAHG